MKDHLGNVRSVINREYSTLMPTFTAGMAGTLVYRTGLEIAQAGTEGAVWDLLNNVRDNKPGSIDTSDTTAAELLGTDTSKMVATSIMLTVMPGDEFTVSGSSFYDSLSTGDTVAGANIVNALLNALLGGSLYDGTPISELKQNQQILHAAIGNPSFADLYNGMLNDNYDPSRPAAFINYMVFDERFNLIPEQNKPYSLKTL